MVAFVCVTTIEIKRYLRQTTPLWLEAGESSYRLLGQVQVKLPSVLVHAASFEQFPRFPLHSSTSEKSPS